MAYEDVENTAKSIMAALCGTNPRNPLYMLIGQLAEGQKSTNTLIRSLAKENKRDDQSQETILINEDYQIKDDRVSRIDLFLHHRLTTPNAPPPQYWTKEVSTCLSKTCKGNNMHLSHLMPNRVAAITCRMNVQRAIILVKQLLP